MRNMQITLARKSGMKETTPMTLEQRLRSARAFLQHQVNSITVYRNIDGAIVLDTAQTYEMRMNKITSSLLPHHLPPNVTIKMDGITAEARLYRNGKEYHF